MIYVYSETCRRRGLAHEAEGADATLYAESEAAAIARARADLAQRDPRPGGAAYAYAHATARAVLAALDAE